MLARVVYRATFSNHCSLHYHYLSPQVRLGNRSTYIHNRYLNMIILKQYSFWGRVYVRFSDLNFKHDPQPSRDYVTTRVAFMFSWRITMHA